MKGARRRSLAKAGLIVIGAIGLLSACVSDEIGTVVSNVESESGSDATFENGANWKEAEAIFRREPRWLGADVSASIDLRDGRVLWLFGDTFVATSKAHVRSESTLVRNSVALQIGYNPANAGASFAWRSKGDVPASFFAEEDQNWFWPQTGLRLEDGRVVVFLAELRPTPGEGFGFTDAGWKIARFDGTQGAPTDWPVTRLASSSRFDLTVGTAVVRQGDYVVAFSRGNGSAHAGYLARFRTADLVAGVVTPEWWTGEPRGWLTESAFEGMPAAIVDDLGSECSVHFDPSRNQWVHIASRGFGGTTIAMRTAPALEGPWSPPTDIFTPEESRGPNPFVYAAKAHAELAGAPSGLVITYAVNSLNFSDLLGPSGADLYWPRVIRLRLP